MKFNRLLLMGFMLAGLLAYISCRKADSSPQNQPPETKTLEYRFFNSHRSADQKEKALVEFVKRKMIKTTL